MDTRQHLLAGALSLRDLFVALRSISFGWGKRQQLTSREEWLPESTCTVAAGSVLDGIVKEEAYSVVVDQNGVVYVERETLAILGTSRRS